MIERLDPDIVESGKRDPFVRALVEDLKSQLAAKTTIMVAKGVLGENVAGLAGRCAELMDTINLIEKAKGRVSE